MHARAPTRHAKQVHAQRGQQVAARALDYGARRRHHQGRRLLQQLANELGHRLRRRASSAGVAQRALSSAQPELQPGIPAVGPDALQAAGAKRRQLGLAAVAASNGHGVLQLQHP